MTTTTYVSDLKVMLSQQMITPGAHKRKGLELAALAIEIREKMRNNKREVPTADEAKALIMISQAATRLSSPKEKMPDMCFLTEFEMSDYQMLV